MENNTLLDQVDMPIEQSYERASQGKRFLTFLIDYILIIVLMVLVILTIGTGTEMGIYAIFYVSFWLYYTVMEALGGRTIGKYITGTIVVRTQDLQAPTISQCMGRSISRFVPFEPFSFLSGVSGWHDDWTNTMVVNVRSLTR